MGFFSSSRRTDTAAQASNASRYVTTTTTTTINAGGDKSVVQTIRSRFSGKRGKEREDQLPIHPSSSKNASKPLRSTTSILLNPSTPSYDSSIGASPRPSTSQRPLPIHALRKTSHYDDRALPATPQKQSRSIEAQASTSSMRSMGGFGTPEAREGESSVMFPSTPLKKNTDSVTVTLAQRLNELALANAEGLLNDDEYRLLRQSLFDRFAGTSVVPQEEALVPAVRPKPRKPDTPATDPRPTTRPISNFQVEIPRPSSTHSNRNSMTFGVSDLFRKATSRRSSSVAQDTDAASIWSAKSSSSRLFRLPRALSRKSSNSSIITTESKAPADTMSISSKRGKAGGSSDRGHGDTRYSSETRSMTGSVRRRVPQTPPSSFPGTRGVGQDSRPSTTIRDVFDENLKTSKDIKKEITAVEAEQRRLIDAFNGLELTTLSKARRHHQAGPSLKGSDSIAESQWGGSDTKSHKRFNPSESDAVSVRSRTSIKTTPSVAPSIPRSASSARNKTLRAKSNHAFNPSLNLASPSSLHRKDSSSSFTSGGGRFERTLGTPPPPVPAIPLTVSHGHLRAANNSSISLARSNSHLPMDVVHEDEDRSTVDTARPEEESEQELEDIRRRREEVNMRYEARLEYLRAKLKGAQLHEKLLKK